MNSRGGVYLGSGATIFGMVAEVSGATGGAASINSNRFSFCLGMKGPSMTIDTEGASSLSAIHLGAPHQTPPPHNPECHPSILCVVLGEELGTAAEPSN